MSLAVQQWAAKLGAGPWRLEAPAPRAKQVIPRQFCLRHQASALHPPSPGSLWHGPPAQRPRRELRNLPVPHCLQPEAAGKGELELPAESEDPAGPGTLGQGSLGASSGDSSDEGSPRRTVGVQFKCNKCGATSVRYVNPVALTKGTIFLQCANCNAIHKIVDNLDLIQEYRLNEESDSPVKTDPELRYNVEIKLKDSDGNTQTS